MREIALRMAGVICLSIMLVIQIGHARAADCDAPKSDFKIAAPASSVAPSAAAFSGVWAGTWTFEVSVGRSRGNAIQCNVLHVSVTDNQRAKVVDCVGSILEFNQGPRCDALDAKISNGELSYTAVNGSARSLKLAGPGTLAVQSINRQNKTNATELHKQ